MRAGTFARLAVLLALLASISLVQLVRDSLGTPVTLAAGALLLSGLFAGKLAEYVGLPRLTGYLLIGILVGPFGLRFIPKEGVVGLELVKGLAVALIALTAGTELQLGLLRRVGARAIRLSAIVSIAVAACVVAVTLTFASRIPFLDGFSTVQNVAVAALLASVLISFSPTVTIAVVQETRAKGPFTEFVLAMVIIGDLLVMVAFALAAGLTRASFGGEIAISELAGGIGWELFGSVVIGAAIGIAVLLYLRRVGGELALFITALCFLLAEAGSHLHLSPLLLALAAGAVISNLDEREGERLNHAVERAGLPVFALFFAAAGAGLALDALIVVGPLAVALTGLRAFATWASCRWLGDDEAVRGYAWMGLISQAGVTFGLAALVARTFPTFGPEVEVLILAVITLNQLAGPVLMRRALIKTGEVPLEPAATR